MKIDSVLNSPYWIRIALRTMEIRALELGLTRGVAAVSIDEVGADFGHIYTRAVRNQIQRQKRSEDDPATNYLGVVLEKIAVMKATFFNSGTFKSVKNGETKYKGGLVVEAGRFTIYVAFSGGTEEQDVKIAFAGMRELLPDS